MTLKRHLHISFSLLFLLFIHASDAQRAKSHTLTPDEAKIAKKDAAVMFAAANFKDALKAYLDLVKVSPKNYEYNVRTGYCYLMSNSIKANAIPYFEAAYKMKEAKKDLKYFLGMSYMNADRWDEAILMFYDYSKLGDERPDKDLLPVERMIDMCYNGKELAKTPVKIKYENLGKAINSTSEDYNPYISADGRVLVYTTRRKGNMGGFIEDLGMYSADIYSTMWKDTGFMKAKSIGAGVNTDWDEESVGLTPDGECMFVYFDNMDFFGDLGISTLKGKAWQKPRMLGEVINSKYMESGASLSLDGTTLYFASERKEGQGLSDIWVSNLESTGSWGTPKNLGNVVNSKWEEVAPFIAMDGKTLFFSSRGHKSMGGFDIFKTVFDSATGKWSEPVNLGYPINTADDETSFSMTGNGRTAYISAVGDIGLGDKDIYRITFNDQSVYPFMSLISGAVTSSNGAKVELRDVSLLTKDKKVVQTYKPYFLSNRYVLSARPGEYILKVDGYGFLPIEQMIKIDDTFPPSDYEKNISVTIAK